MPFGMHQVGEHPINHTDYKKRIHALEMHSDEQFRNQNILVSVLFARFFQSWVMEWFQPGVMHLAELLMLCHVQSETLHVSLSALMVLNSHSVHALPSSFFGALLIRFVLHGHTNSPCEKLLSQFVFEPCCREALLVVDLFYGLQASAPANRNSSRCLSTTTAHHCMAESSYRHVKKVENLFVGSRCKEAILVVDSRRFQASAPANRNSSRCLSTTTACRCMAASSYRHVKKVEDLLTAVAK